MIVAIIVVALVSSRVHSQNTEHTMSWKISVVSILMTCCCCRMSNGFTAQRIVYPGQNEFFELSILHINDFHARFVQTNSASNTCRPGREHECIGGLGRVVTVSRELMNERPNAIFLNAGDNFQGTMWYNVHKWNATAHFINKLPHDAMTFGNHDFDDGVEGLVPFLQRVNTPVLVCNIDASEEPSMQGLYQNSTVIVRGNQKIGIIGVILKTTNILSDTGKLKFLDEVESVNTEATRLKAKGVNIIIVLSHVGFDVDQIIAANCPDVDVIVGGHSHTFLYSGKAPFTDNPTEEYPMVVKQKTTNRPVLIVQASAFTRYLGNLTVWFDQQGELADWEGNPIFLDNFIEEDPEIIEELKPWAEAVEEASKKIVGKTRSYLSNSCKLKECNMANLITDAMVNWYEKKAESPKHWTYAAISVANAGGIRTNLSPGTLTFGDLATVLPFEHTWDVVELKGEDIHNVVEESVSRHGQKFARQRYLQWSGLKVVFDLSKPASSRVHSLSVRCQACKEPEYEPLDRNKWYRVVVVSFIIEGGDALTVIADKHRNRQIGPLDVSALEDYVQSISPFTYELDERVQLIS